MLLHLFSPSLCVTGSGGHVSSLIGISIGIQSLANTVTKELWLTLLPYFLWLGLLSRQCLLQPNILAAFAGPNQRAPSWFSIECLNGPKTLKKNAAAVEGGWVTVSLLHIWALFGGLIICLHYKKSFIIMNFLEKGLKSILDQSHLQIAISNVNSIY